MTCDMLRGEELVGYVPQAPVLEDVYRYRLYDTTTVIDWVTHLQPESYRIRLQGDTSESTMKLKRCLECLNKHSYHY